MVCVRDRCLLYQKVFSEGDQRKRVGLAGRLWSRLLQLKAGDSNASMM